MYHALILILSMWTHDPIYSVYILTRNTEIAQSYANIEAP
jgi:hypothetical protein